MVLRSRNNNNTNEALLIQGLLHQQERESHTKSFRVYVQQLLHLFITLERKKGLDFIAFRK